MPITFISTGSSPADAGTQAGPTITIAPPVINPAIAGDLVVLVLQYKSSGVTFSMSKNGGQQWTSESQFANSITGRIFWSTFNGTWRENPEITITAGTNGMSAQMVIFRPSLPGYLWSASTAQSSSAFPTVTTPFEVIAGSRNVPEVSSLGFATYMSNDDNTWTTQSSLWSSGAAQLRNLDGTDMSMTHRFKIFTASTSTGTSIARQATNGGDSGVLAIIVFAEMPPQDIQYTTFQSVWMD
jgi:hypothetical protein